MKITDHMKKPAVVGIGHAKTIKDLQDILLSN